MSQRKINGRKLLVRLGRIFGVMFGLPLVLLFGGLLLRRGAAVILDNGNDFAVRVSVDGKDVGSLAAHAHRSIASQPGDHTVVARGPDGVVDDGRFTIPASKGALDSFRGVYNIGGAARYVTVSVCYGSPYCDHGVDGIGEGQRFFQLPVRVSTELDAPIPSTGHEGSHIFFCHAGATRHDFACPAPDGSLLGQLGLR
jgi:hypothetical protein